MSFSFENKRVLVTGAAQGIGKSIVLKLAQSGAKVIAVDYNSELLKNLQNEVKSIETATVDLSNWSETETKIKSLYPIDLLVNNAGIAIIGPSTEITEDQVDRLFAVNVKGLINVTKLVIQDLVRRDCGGGAVVSISSQASKVGLFEHGLYCASKGAVDAFTRAAALEFGPKNIRFNCVNPTVVMTELGKKVWSDPMMGGPMLAKIPLQRFAEIDDVVDAVLFLLSDGAKMITGTCLPVDGGFLAC